ncbi:MAG TPA: hypothetical protein VHN37_04370 [Actinomycetota bacterium]|nr:hypothetical protein [Actinomycetota bacterium]
MRSLFDDASERVAVPPADLGAVVRRGEARRRRRIAGRAASLIVVALAGSAAGLILAGQEGSPLPATRDEAPEPGGRLVPVVMSGPSPWPELAAAEDLAAARAVTVAFHALLDSATRYRFDYRGVEEVGGRWRVEFVEHGSLPPVLRELARARAHRTTQEAQVAANRAELAAHARRIRTALEEALGTDREPELRRSHRSVGEEVRRLERVAAQTAAEIEEIESRIRSFRRRQPSYRVFVTVAEAGGRVFVEDVTTASPNPSIPDAIGYAERAADVDSWGADYFRLAFRRPDGRPDGVYVFVRPFWTGPLSSPYEERCRAQVTGPGGEAVWTQPEPHRLTPFTSAPASEDARDGGQLRFGFDYEGTVSDLSLRMLCEWRPRQ